MSFPRAKWWDIMDAFAYIIELLEVGERYMHRKVYEDVEDPEDVEKEFAELEREFEDPLEGWRYEFE